MTSLSRRVFSTRLFRHHFIAPMKLHSQKASCSTSPSTADDFLRRQRVQFTTSEGDTIDVEAVFQDTLPSGSQLGTVLAIHGAPGSHKDYKYDTLPSGSRLGTVLAIHGAPGSHKDYKYVTPLLHKKGIRFIGVNMPGFGLTPGDPRLKCNNVERNNFVHELIAKIENLNGLVLMGHSRGSENAANVAARNVSMLSGLVLVNPTGLEYHRAMRPLWVLNFVLWLYTLGPVAHKVMHPLMKFFYNNVLGLRLDSGERAMMCVKTMHSLEYEKAMRPSINAINEKNDVRVLVAYAGKDPLIETKISRDLADSFRGHKELMCEDKSDSAEEEVTKETRNLFSNGARTVSVNFKKDGHFLQRDRARFIADSIEAMLRS
ncbi:hypothetical protein OESDEN_09745 [Oesophagostomum dentatum]|uniref:AB hydrolase-1 domain-containing protein n=1 Tax=Oesophagostomum dentatum TaxID=61180 RepID=A0A0B1T3N5_OESDE|nr:hypothetical protein OESDEN_09745 [Oesophagostomum dentatum]